MRSADLREIWRRGSLIVGSNTEICAKFLSLEAVSRK